MRRFGTSLALSAALVSGCSAGNETQSQQPSESTAITTAVAPAAPTQPPPPTYEQAKAEVIQDFDAAKGYWAGRGVNLSATQLQFVEGDQTVDCGNTYHSSDLAAGYCYKIGELFVTQAWLSYMNSDSFFPRSPDEVPRNAVLVAHELGHNQQDIAAGAGVNELLTDYQNNPVKYELQADCYAGQTVRTISPEVIGKVLSPDFVYFPGDDNQPKNVHGTTAQRRASFVAGFTGSSCTIG
jgi:predicted metalloprotease